MVCFCVEILHKWCGNLLYNFVPYFLYIVRFDNSACRNFQMNVRSYTVCAVVWDHTSQSSSGILKFPWKTSQKQSVFRMKFEKTNVLCNMLLNVKGSLHINMTPFEVTPCIEFYLFKMMISIFTADLPTAKYILITQYFYMQVIYSNFLLVNWLNLPFKSNNNSAARCNNIFTMQS